MPALNGDSADSGVPAVSGQNTAGGDGVTGTGRRGVVGISDAFQGVFGKSIANAGVVGESTDLHGIFGICHNRNGAGVYGTNDNQGFGLQGVSQAGIGIIGSSESGSGIRGESRSGRAIEGWSQTNYGVSGDSHSFAGVRGTSVSGTGTEGWSTSGTGVFATTVEGVALHARGGRLAGYFEGDVEISGDIRLLNADCAEDFDIDDTFEIEPGTVMVLGSDGRLQRSSQAYDKRVAGVVSGAGTYRPGIVLDKRQSTNYRLPIALLGKVFCRVDAAYGAIEVGDLLTTSATPGHAMKADQPQQAFGATLGKALHALDGGRAIIPILVALG